MKPTRLFTFGCSFTNYVWPTWADIIGSKYKLHYNLGSKGAGNYYVASKLYETHLNCNITKDDNVIIMLSSANRLDIYDENTGKFNLNGNIYNSEHIFGKKFVKKVWNDTHSIYNTWFCVKTIKTLLDTIGCRYKIVEAFGLLNADTGNILNTNDSIKNLLNDYENLVYTNQSLNRFAENYNPSTYKLSNGRLDGHPTIICNHDFVKKHISEFYDDKMYEVALKWESEMLYQIETANRFSDINFSKQYINTIRRL
jgi:hypothetical protein